MQSQNARFKLITVKPINPTLIEEAVSLLYEANTYQQEGPFLDDDRPRLFIKPANKETRRSDHFNDHAIWFGAFDQEHLVGCVRLFHLMENHPSDICHELICQTASAEERGRCYEIENIAIKENYTKLGIVKRLLLACFQFCQEQQYSLAVFTHNRYLISLFEKVEFPLQREHAFKYAPQDVTPVNFYFASYKNSQVAVTLQKLEDSTKILGKDVTDIFKLLESVESILPTPFYWMSTQGMVLGINTLMLKAMGTTCEIIGKKPYSFYRPEVAEHILKHNAEVMSKEEILAQEEWIEDITTKERKCFSSIKAPLYDEEGTVIGIVGTSLEVTAQKELELLKQEHARQQAALLHEKEKSIQLAHKVLHDITSPLTALNMMVPMCNELPEKKRALVKQATESILDIANNLLNYYRKESDPSKSVLEERQSLLVSDALIQLLSEKRVQYRNRPVTFETAFATDAQFAFIHIQPTEFRRSMSNLINNAVDALTNNVNDLVTIRLSMDAKNVFINIEDNGKGMSPATVQKIQDNQSFTEGKENGHGLGLQQVWDTLTYNQARMEVRSTVGNGTSIQLIFPRAATPHWIVKKIHLAADNILVILDDEDSIHTAWDLRFAALLTSYPTLQLHHFKQGNEALDFFAGLRQQEKDRVIFLSDYELLHQDKNGLQIIEASKIKRTILVTSYYSKIHIQKETERLGIKVLPKQLASIISIYIGKFLNQ